MQPSDVQQVDHHSTESPDLARWLMMLALLSGERLTPPEPTRPGPTRCIKASNKAPALWALFDREAGESLDLGAVLPTMAELTAGNILEPSELPAKTCKTSGNSRFNKRRSPAYAGVFAGYKKGRAP